MPGCFDRQQRRDHPCTETDRGLQNRTAVHLVERAIDAAGNVYLGTGGDGKIFKVTAGGTGALFADLAELNVTAVAIAPER